LAKVVREKEEKKWVGDSKDQWAEGVWLAVEEDLLPFLMPQLGKRKGG